MYWDCWTPQINGIVMPWTAEIGNLSDFSYFNKPSLWLEMQSRYAPYQIQDYSMNYQDAYNQGANLMRQMNFNTSLGNTTSSVAKFKSQIENLINSDDISEDKKTLFKEMLDEIKMLEEQLKLINKMAPSGDLGELEKALNDITTNLSDLKNIATEIIQAAEEEIKKAVEEAKNELENTEDPEAKSTINTNENENNGDAEVTSNGKIVSSIGTTGNTSVSTTTSNPKKEAQDICKDIYVAIKGWGTDEKKLDEAIKKINKDNVIEVMDKWQNDYIDGEMIKDDSFLESLFDDVDKKRKKEYTEIIIKALTEVADTKGIDISHYVASIEYELIHEPSYKICKTITKIWEMLTERDTSSRLEAVA